VHLRLAKGRQHRLGKATQFPVLPLIGIRPTGDQHPDLRKGRGELLHGSLDLHAALVGFGDFIQAVEQQQTAGAQELLP
jgi:hypothetical protein